MSEHMMGIYHCWFQSASILLFIYLIIKQMFGLEPLKRWKPRIVIGVCHGEKIGYIPIPYKYIYIYIFIYIYLFIYWGMVINPFSLGFIYALKKQSQQQRGNHTKDATLWPWHICGLDDLIWNSKLTLEKWIMAIMWVGFMGWHLKKNNCVERSVFIQTLIGPFFLQCWCRSVSAVSWEV